MRATNSWEVELLASYWEYVQNIPCLEEDRRRELLKILGKSVYEIGGFFIESNIDKKIINFGVSLFEEQSYLNYKR